MKQGKVVPNGQRRRKSSRQGRHNERQVSRISYRLARRILSAIIMAVLAIGIAGDAAMGLAKGAGDCRVVSVTDGDTVRAWCRGDGIESVRLTGFDTPEIFSPKCTSERLLGTRAYLALKGVLWTAGEVRLTALGRDRYERVLARMLIDGVPIETVLVQRGLAHPYSGGRRQGWCGR